MIRANRFARIALRIARATKSFGLAGHLHVKRHCNEIVEPKFGSQGNPLPANLGCGHGHALTRNTALGVCSFVCRHLFDVPEICPSLCPKQGICKSRDPHAANNAIAIPSLIMEVCLVFACLAMCMFANHFHV